MSLYSMSIGMYFKTYNIDQFSGFERAGGWIGIPNAFAPFPVLSIVFCWYKYKIERKKLYLLLTGIFLFMILTTLSRNAMLAAILFFFIWSYFEGKKTKIMTFTKKYKNIIKAGFIFGIIVCLLLKFWGYTIEQAVFRDINISGRTIQSVRFSFWNAHLISMTHWSISEWFFGIGYENLRNNLEQGLGYYIPAEMWQNISSAENGFFHLFLGSGIVGLLIIIILITISIRKSFRILNGQDQHLNLIGLLSISTIFVLITQALFTDFMYMGITVYYYTIMGLTVKTERFIKMGKSEKCFY